MWNVEKLRKYIKKYTKYPEKWNGIKITNFWELKKKIKRKMKNLENLLKIKNVKMKKFWK